MTEVHRLPDADQVAREASEWIARLNADDVSADDRARFEAWRSAHPLHARAHEALSATWQEFVSAGPLVRAVSFAQSMNEAAGAPAQRRRWALAAAVFAAVVTAATWLYIERLGSGTTFTTAIGEQATVSLPDGSALQLNSNSLARVDYSTGSRVIRLGRGEGYFKVTRDPQRPFWVVGGGSWVRAVGTAFNVYLRPTGVEVTVSEGTVQVGSEDALSHGTPSDEAVAHASVSVLTAGQQADLRGTATATRKLSPAEVQRSVAWREGTVYFENQPLSQVADELGRYTTLKLVVTDDRLGHLPVGGTFRASPQGAEALLTMLEQGFNLRVRRAADRAYIEAKEAEPSE
jgi:transmembrane sensor